jgi:hypothetical protein
LFVVSVIYNAIQKNEHIARKRKNLSAHVGVNVMKRFFQSGGAFMLVALICIGAALLSEYNGVFAGIGVFWLIMAMIVRGKYTKKHKHTEELEGKRDSE